MMCAIIAVFAVLPVFGLRLGVFLRRGGRANIELWSVFFFTEKEESGCRYERMTRRLSSAGTYMNIYHTSGEDARFVTGLLLALQLTDQKNRKNSMGAKPSTCFSSIGFFFFRQPARVWLRVGWTKALVSEKVV